MEREAEEIWTPPETELTKDRSKLPGRRLHTEERIFIEIWGGGGKVRRGTKDGQRQRGIKWTARERGGSTGEDRGIPQWHFIPFSLFLAPLLPISLLFSPNKSFWLILNQLIPSRQLENCNNLSPTCNFSPSLHVSPFLSGLSLSLYHTHKHTHLKHMVVSVEVKVVVVVGRGLHLVPAGHAKNSESIRHCLDVIYLCIKKGWNLILRRHMTYLQGYSLYISVY